MARALVVLGFALVVLAGMGGYGVGAEETATLEERVEALEARLADVEGGVAPVSPNLAPDGSIGSISNLNALTSADPVIVLVCAQTDPPAGLGLNPLLKPDLVAIHCARAPAAP